MKKIIAFFCTSILASLAIGCDMSTEARAGKAQMRASQATANKVVAGIEYIRDPRTGFCFAYYWGGAANGGPALAAVPCESIPPGMLTTAE